MKDELIYWLGFPVIVEDAEVTIMCGEEVLDICPDVVERKAFRSLIFKPGRLTGGELRFIRHFQEMTQTALAEALHQTNHSIVSQWESRLDESTNMNQNTEILLRLLMAKKMLGKTSLDEVLNKLQALPLNHSTEILRLKVSEPEKSTEQSEKKPAKPRARPRTKAAVNVNNAPPV